MVDTMTRNAGLPDLVTLLQEQHVRKIDMVLPATAMTSVDGQMLIKDVGAIVEDDGVTDPNGLYRPTSVFDEGISEKLQIPLAYVRRLRSERPDLYDANVNGLIQGKRPKGKFLSTKGEGVVTDPSRWEETHPGFPADGRSFLFRAFRGDGVVIGDDPARPMQRDTGIARALLSDQYRIVDNLDVLMAVLDGIRDAGVQVFVDRCNLTERRMSVSVVCPEVQVVAERLLEGYRNPFGNDFERWRQVADREGLGYGGSEPVVWAGLKITNSETGDGSFGITPEARIKVCANGLVITKDIVRTVHLGGRLDAGVVRWSDETQKKQVDLIKSKTVDSVKTFLDVEYLTRVIRDIEKDAGTEIEPDEVRVIAKRAKYSDEQIEGIMAHFVRGGQTTRGGLMNAATSFAQIVESPDVAYEMEAKALTLLTV